MKAYNFSLYHMTGIQQGIQAAHAQTALFPKYKNEPEFNELLKWCEHPTTICFKGGDVNALNEIYEFFSREDNPYMFSKFNESASALGGIITNVCILVPSTIHEMLHELVYKKKYTILSSGKSQKKTFSTAKQFMDSLQIHGYDTVNRAYCDFLEDRFCDGLTKFDVELIDFLRKFNLAQ